MMTRDEVQYLEKLQELLHKARQEGDTATADALKWAVDNLEELLPQIS